MQKVVDWLKEQREGEKKMTDEEEEQDEQAILFQPTCNRRLGEERRTRSPNLSKAILAIPWPFPISLLFFFFLLLLVAAMGEA